MGFNPVQPSSGSAANNTQINKLAADVRGSKVTQVFKDSTDRRVLLGKGKNDFYGLKVSKPGFDVYDATDENLVFNSDNNVFKIVKIVTLELPADTFSLGETNTYSASSQVSQLHGLDYTPAFIAYIDDGSGIYDSMPTTYIQGGGTGGGYSVSNYSVYVTPTGVVAVSIGYAYGGFNFSGVTLDARTVKVYLLQETASID